MTYWVVVFSLLVQKLKSSAKEVRLKAVRGSQREGGGSEPLVWLLEDFRVRLEAADTVPTLHPGLGRGFQSQE